MKKRCEVLEGESFSFEAVTSCMDSLPQVVPQGFTSLQYRFFPFFFVLSEYYGKTKILAHAGFIIIQLQKLATAIAGFLVMDSLKNKENSSSITKIFLFILTFKGHFDTDIPSLHSFFIFQFFGVLIIFSFGIGIYKAQKNERINSYISCIILSAFLFFQLIMICPLTAIFSRQLSILISGHLEWAIGTIFTGVLWACLTIIYFFNVLFLHSIFYMNGKYILTFNSFIPTFSFLIFIIIIFGSANLLTAEYNFIVISICNLVTGVVFIFHSYDNYFFSDSQTAFGYIVGIISITSGVIHAYLSKKLNVNMINYILIISLIAFILCIILPYAFQFMAKKRAKKMISCNNFDELKLNSRSFIRYYINGFLISAPCVIDGSFLVYGLNKFNINRYAPILTILTSFLPPNTPGNSIVESILSRQADHYLISKFILYQSQNIKNMMTTVLVSPEKQICNVLTNAVNHFTTLFSSYSKIAKVNFQDYFRYGSALTCVRDVLEAYIWYFNVRYPNSAEFMNLYANYLQRVAFSTSANEVSQTAREISKKHYMKILSVFPVISEFPAAAEYLEKSVEYPQLTEEVEEVHNPSTKKSVHNSVWPITFAVFVVLILALVGSFIFNIAAIQIAWSKTEKVSDITQIFAQLSFSMGAVMHLPAIPEVLTKLTADEQKEFIEVIARKSGDMQQSMLKLRETISAYQTTYDSFRWLYYELFRMHPIDIESRYASLPYHFFGVASEIFPEPNVYLMDEMYSMLEETLYAISYHFNVLEQKAVESIQNSLHGIEQGLSLMMGSSALFVFIVLIIFSIMPLIYRYHVHKYAKAARCSDEKDQLTLHSLYIRSNFKSLKYLIVQNFVIVFIMAVIAFAPYICVHAIEGGSHKLSDKLGTAIREAQQSFHISSLIAMIELNWHGYVKNKTALDYSLDLIHADLQREMDVVLNDTDILLTKFVSICSILQKIVENGSEADEYVVLNISRYMRVVYIKTKENATKDYIEKANAESYPPKILLNEVLVVSMVLFAILTIVIYRKYILIDRSAQMCFYMMLYLEVPTSAEVSGNILDLIDRPAAIYKNGVVQMLNTHASNRFGELEDIVGTQLPDITHSDQYVVTSLPDGGLLYEGRVSADIMEYTIKKNTVEEEIRRLEHTIFPSASEFRGYIAVVAMEFAPYMNAMSESETWRAIADFGAELNELVNESDGTRLIRWSVRGHSVIVQDPRRDRAIIKALDIAARMFLYTVDLVESWGQFVFSSVITSTEAPIENMNAKTLSECIPESKLIHSLNSNRILIDSLSVDALGPLASYLPIESCPEGFCITDKPAFNLSDSW